MAEVINALFKAQETISKALRSASDATDSFERDLSGLSTSMANASLNSQGAEQEFEEFANSLDSVAASTRNFDENLEEAQKAMIRYSLAGEDSEQASQELRNAMMKLNASANSADSEIDNLSQAFNLLRTSGSLSGEQLGDLQTRITNVAATTRGGTSTVSGLNRALLATYGASLQAERATNRFSEGMAGLAGASIGGKEAMDSVEKSTSRFRSSLASLTFGIGATVTAEQSLQRATKGIENDMDGARNSSLGLAGALGILSGAAKGTALEFGSLSVNIGPFNLALRNFLTQVPAILTGMGSMLALVTSLIVAFATLGAVTGALLVGGAIAWFEEFSSQFEETGEAVEALGAALRELFTAAIEPLMNAGNIDLFTGFINDLAEITNRFAQFAQMMRGDVLEAISQMEGDVDNFFTAMKVSFELLEPVLIGIMNFFLNDFPPILERFAVLTRRISGDINILIGSVGGLMNQLLDLASVILAGLAPALGIILVALTDAFILINQLPDALLAGAIAGAILTLAVVKLALSLASLGSSIAGVTGLMAAQAGTGTFLGFVYTTLTNAARVYTTTNATLLQTIAAVISQLLSKAAVMELAAISTIKESTAVAVLTTAYNGLISRIKATRAWMWASAIATKALAAAKTILSGAILGTIGFLFGEAAATQVAAAGNLALAAASFAAGSAMSLLSAAVNTTIAPLWLIVGVIGVLVAALIGLAQYLTNFNIFQPLIDGANFLISKLQDIIGLLGIIPGMGGGVGEAEMGANIDDIQTRANMNLNFEETTENNMDINADPEEKSQLSRVVKDAMEEANSMNRQKNGFTGN